MKSCLTLLMLISVSAFASPRELESSPKRLIACTAQQYSLATGDLIAGGSAWIREGAHSWLALGGSSTAPGGLELSWESVSTCIDGCDVERVTAHHLAAHQFFNSAGTFGDRKTFGTWSCGLPEEKSFYFVIPSENPNGVPVILTGERPGKSDLYEKLLREGACLSGNAKLAIEELRRYWYLPVDRLEASASGIRWDEVKKECIGPEYNSDTGGTDCTGGIREVSRIQKLLPFCLD